MTQLTPCPQGKKALARAIGHENLTKPDLADPIAELQAERQARTEVTADYVINEIKRNYEATRAKK